MGCLAAMQQGLTIWCMPLLLHAQFATGFHFHNEWCTKALGDKFFNPWLLKTSQNVFLLILTPSLFAATESSLIYIVNGF